MDRKPSQDGTDPAAHGGAAPDAPHTRPSRRIEALIEIMAALRTPVTGCNWDLAQTFETIAPYTIEEAYEVADAVDRGDRDDLRDELGDLLLQVVFHARLAEEQGAFDFGGVVEAITSKLIRRHPHIFGPRRDLTAEDVRGQWDRIKAEEKALKAARSPAHRRPEGHLASVGAGLPPLLRALKLQAKASEVGFDWNDPHAVLDKIREETGEAEAALGSPAAAEEIGDLLFAVVNLARHEGVDPDAALRSASRKFEKRFSVIEQTLVRQGKSLQEADLATMEAIWVAAKSAAE